MGLRNLKIIASQYQFDLTTEEAQEIPGGPGGGHVCWKIQSDKGMLFIKQLDPGIDVHNKESIARYELCESVAYRLAQQGIPAEYAIKNGDKYVSVLENTAYIVYPWIEGYTLGSNEISDRHSVIIAELLAKMHVINLNVPEIEPKLDVHSNERIIASIEQASKLPVYTSLQKHQEMIISMNEKYHSVISVLKDKTVITHGDVFKHNVIWKEPAQPFLIDWEAVKKMNPTREAIRTCLAWSGNGDDISFPLFEKMLHTYINFGGPLDKNHVDAGLKGMYGNIINWLLYNIEMACTSDSARINDKAVNAINNSLNTGARLNELYPRLFYSIIHAI